MPFLKILFIYFERERKGERKSGRETSMCERNIDQYLSHVPNQGGGAGGLGGPGRQPRHVPWPEIESATFQFTG